MHLIYLIPWTYQPVPATLIKAGKLPLETLNPDPHGRVPVSNFTYMGHFLRYIVHRSAIIFIKARSVAATLRIPGRLTAPEDGPEPTRVRTQALAWCSRARLEAVGIRVNC